MSIVETLNNITTQLNTFADKITSGNEQYTDSENDLTELGNINKDNSNGSLESPRGINDKIDTDSKMLVTDMSRFNSSEEYMDYLEKWIRESEIFESVNRKEFIEAFITRDGIQHKYNIYGTLNLGDTSKVIGKITDDQVENIIITYNNFTLEQIPSASKLNIQLVGISEILEINHAIELGYRRLPYVTFGKDKFVNLIAYELNTKYKLAQQ